MASAIRTCIGCRAKSEGAKMLRFVRHKDGELVFDASRSASGRGAHTCNARRCVELAFERRAFKRAFKGEILTDDRFLESVVF